MVWGFGACLTLIQGLETPESTTTGGLDTPSNKPGELFRELRQEAASVGGECCWGELLCCCCFGELACCCVTYVDVVLLDLLFEGQPLCAVR